MMDDEKKVMEPVEETETAADAPEADKADQAVSKAEEAKQAAIDEMEKASQKALEAMREQNNSANEQVVDEAQKKLDDIFVEFRAWMETNSQPDQVKANLKDLGEKVNSLLEKTRARVIDVAQSEQFKSTMESGKDFLVGTGAMIADGLKYGYDKLMEIPELKKAAGYVDKKVDKLRQSDVLKSVVEHSEQGINEFNNALFQGLKSFFSPKEEPAKPEEAAPAPQAASDEAASAPEHLPDLPENEDSKAGE